MRRSLKELMARAAMAWRQKRSQDPYLADAYTLALPGNDATNPYRVHGDVGIERLGVTLPSGFEGQNDYAVVLDGTLATSLSRGVNRVMSELFPAGADWCDLRARESVEGGVKLEADPALQEALDTAQTLAFTSLHASNVDVQLTGAMTDAWIGGMGLMRVHPRPEGPDGPLLGFEAVSAARVPVEYGPTGEIEALYRPFRLSREHAMAMWPDAERIDDPTGPSPEEKAAPVLTRFTEATYLDRSERTWRTAVWQEDGPGGPHVVWEEEFELNPWIVWLYDKVAGMNALRSPVLRAMPFARTLNQMAFDTLEATAFAAQGMVMVEQGSIVNTAKNVIRPGGILHLRRGALTGAAGPALQPLNTGARLDLAHMKREELVMHLKQAMLDESLPEPSAQPRSATEVLERKRELRANIGAFYGRLVRGAGVPIVQHVLYALERDGQLADVGFEVGAGGVASVVREGKRAEIVFANPLLRQQHLTDSQNVVQASMVIREAYGPEAQHITMKVPAAARYIAEKMEVPEELIHDEREADERWQQMTGQLAQGTGALAGGAAAPSAPAAGPPEGVLG